MNILLIWDTCGEGELELFVATGEAATLVAQCHGQYVNSSGIDDDAPIYTLSEHYLGYDEKGEKIPLPGNMKKIDDLTAPCGPFDRVVVCGFLP